MSRDQIFTPEAVAAAMADLLLGGSNAENIKLLEPGAGAGALIDAVLERTKDREIRITAVELDPVLASHLRGIELRSNEQSVDVVQDDFLNFALNNLWRDRYSHVVMNPPYAKLSSRSSRAGDLRKLGLYAPNLYAAFILCASALLADGGTLVALVPRSFFNGPHFKAMRRTMSAAGHIDVVVTFKTRTGVFKRDSILQDVVVIRFIRSRHNVSAGVQLIYADDDMSQKQSIMAPRARIERPNDEDAILHVPSDVRSAELAPPWEELRALDVEGVSLSTGPVVDFRVNPPLSTVFKEGMLPVFGAELFRMDAAPRFAVIESLSAAQIYKPGLYVVVKRISPKEQRPRLQFKVVDASGSKDRNGISFENHLHVFHHLHGGLRSDECDALIERLGSSQAERYFVEMSGSTQVNASDIRRLIWP